MLNYNLIPCSLMNLIKNKKASVINFQWQIFKCRIKRIGIYFLPISAACGIIFLLYIMNELHKIEDIKYKYIITELKSCSWETKQIAEKFLILRLQYFVCLKILIDNPESDICSPSYYLLLMAATMSVWFILYSIFIFYIFYSPTTSIKKTLHTLNKKESKLRRRYYKKQIWTIL